jgi:ABC-type transport system involved in multi-copper enzyme maturation permease subunit
MTIREKGYHRWDGQLLASGIRWLPMFFLGIKMVFKRKYAKGLFFFSALPFVFFLAALYVSTKPELKMFRELVKLLKINDATFFNAFTTNGTSIFFLMLMGIFFGAELISGDIQFKSFPLYFSRPLDRKDYLLGKYSILMFYYLLFTFVPCFVLVIFKFIFTGSLSIDPLTLLAIIITPILVALFFASLTLMVSSLSGNSKYTRIILVLILFMSQPIAQLLKLIFKSDYFFMLSFQENLQQMGSFLFRIDPKFSYPGWMSAVVVLLFIAGAYFILYRRIGKLEAQIESGN